MTTRPAIPALPYPARANPRGESVPARPDNPDGARSDPAHGARIPNLARARTAPGTLSAMFFCTALGV